MKRLSITQELAIWNWYQAKRNLGTFKTKAREMGVYPTLVSECVYKYRCMNGEYTRKRGRA